MRVRLLLPVVVTALLAFGGALLLLGGGGSNSDDGTYISEHPVTVPEAARMVTVSATMPMPSAHARRLSTMLEEGAMPRSAMMAEVLTDSECVPDERMISHCRNEVRLANGRRIVLRHPHDMRAVPCLAPGERVLLVPSA